MRPSCVAWLVIAACVRDPDPPPDRGIGELLRIAAPPCEADPEPTGAAHRTALTAEPGRAGTFHSAGPGRPKCNPPVDAGTPAPHIRSLEPPCYDAAESSGEHGRAGSFGRADPQLERRPCDAGVR
jgi:hypothetical protein